MSHVLLTLLLYSPSPVRHLVLNPRTDRCPRTAGSPGSTLWTALSQLEETSHSDTLKINSCFSSFVFNALGGYYCLIMLKNILKKTNHHHQ